MRIAFSMRQSIDWYAVPYFIYLCVKYRCGYIRYVKRNRKELCRMCRILSTIEFHHAILCLLSNKIDHTINEFKVNSFEWEFTFYFILRTTINVYMLQISNILFRSYVYFYVLYNDSNVKTLTGESCIACSASFIRFEWFGSCNNTYQKQTKKKMIFFKSKNELWNGLSANFVISTNENMNKMKNNNQDSTYWNMKTHQKHQVKAKQP